MEKKRKSTNYLKNFWKKLMTKKTKPIKLIRHLMADRCKDGETTTINDLQKLNELYELKVKEELEEIKSSDHKDIMEFVDLIQVAYSFAKINGFTFEQVTQALIEKSAMKGVFKNVVLTQLNPHNPSNKIYFQ
jgi:predicted house-cleaning noncanonical NTP pyrophosphatase (MazG superfamily)